MSFKEMLVLYFENYKTKVEKSTFETKKYIFDRAFKDSTLPDKDISGISEIDLINLKQDLLIKYSNDTVRSIYSTVMNILQLAVDLKFLEFNISKKVENVKPKGNIRSIKIVTPEQFQSILNSISIDQKDKKVFLNLLFRTGLRNSEARALLWKDIDFHDKILTVNKSILCKKILEYEIKAAKTRSSNRTLLLDDKIIAELKEFREKNDYIKQNDFIFNFEGIPHPQHFGKEVLRFACKRAGIQDISTHALRHSHATYLMRSKVNPELVARRLGHSSSQTTLMMYTHLCYDDNAEIIDALDKI